LTLRAALGISKSGNLAFVAPLRGNDAKLRSKRQAQQLLDGARVRACFQQVGGEAVPQGVGRDGITQARNPAGALSYRLQAAHGVVFAGVLALQEPVLRLVILPISPEYL
jgi:hypothetical protein